MGRVRVRVRARARARARVRVRVRARVRVRVLHNPQWGRAPPNLARTRTLTSGPTPG